MVAFFCPPPFWSGRGPSSLIDRTAGTNIGDMTTGGLALAFDGVTNANGANSSRKQSGGNAYIGKTLAAPTAIDYVIVYGANDHGYVVNNNPDIVINLRGKNGAAPSGTSDGDLIGTTGTFTDTATTNPKTIDCIDKNTAYDHVFVEIVNDTSSNTRMAEVEIYGWQ